MGPRAVLTLVLLCCTAAVLGCGEEQPSRAPAPTAPKASRPLETPPSIPTDAPTVAFLGDSLSAGMQLASHEAFPAVLQRTLAKEGLPFRLVNAGVSGNTTGAGLARVDWILKQKPAIVVVQLGANDGFRGLSLPESEKNIRAILAKVEQQGARALLLGMQLPPNYGADYTRDFRALYERIAQDMDVAYVPFFMDGVAGVAKLNLADGIHPTAEGHRKLAENLRAPLARVLRD